MTKAGEDSQPALFQIFASSLKLPEVALELEVHRSEGPMDWQ